MHGRLGPVGYGRAGSAAGMMLVGVLLTSGCGSAPPPVSPPKAAASGAAGSITVQSIFVLPPTSGKAYAAGSTAYADVSVFNSASSRDVLLGATSPRASSTLVQLDGGTDKMVNVPAVGEDSRGVTVVLQGLTSALSPGQTIPITLDFQTAGQLTLDAPVRRVGT